MFADRVKIIIRSGKGGDGHVSFRREKYVPDGGPDGGDGGRGGDVIFAVDKGINTLGAYRHKRKFSAADGKEGEKRRRHGADGEDIILKVPEGTLIRDAETGKIIADMSGENEKLTVLKGGHGGKGNMHYATSVMQAPRYASPGGEARQMEVILELKLIADAGLIGFPSAGKSTFLAKVSNASPKIAEYHFTTLEPMLGVVDLDGCEGIVIADIPGLIEGASEGAGLGHEFLRHIERNRVFIHIVDAAGVEGRDPVEDVRLINSELEKYDESLLEKPQVIAANKTDLRESYPGLDENIAKLKSTYEPLGYKVFPVSAMTGEGISSLLYQVKAILDTLPKEPLIFEPEFDPSEDKDDPNLPFTVEYDTKRKVYVVEGPRVERMLGYTNLESEKGFAFFQNFVKTSGVQDKLEKLGIKDGETVDIYGLQFEYLSEDFNG